MYTTIKRSPLLKNKIVCIDKWYLLIPIFLGILFFITNYQRDWSTNADQEFTLAYSAALINGGFNQDYYDHPGFFTIYILGGILGFLKYIGINSISTLNELNSFNPFFDGLTQITVGARLLSFLTIGLFTLFWYSIAKRYLQNQYLALGTAFIIFFSGSLTLHLSQLRTEPIAFLLLIIAVFFISKLVNTRGYAKIAYFFIALTFFFLSALNKTQIIFYIPIFTFWVLYFFPCQTPSIKIYYQHPTQVILMLLSIAFCILLSINAAITPSQYFIVIFLLVSYGLIYLYWLSLGGNVCAQITLFNLFFIAIYVLLQWSLKIFGVNHIELLKQIQSPLVMLMFANPDAQNAIIMKGNLDLDLNKLILLIVTPIKSILGSLNSQSIWFYSDLLLLMKLWQKLNRQQIIAVVVSLFCFLIITLISSARGLQPQYIIFSEFFLMISFIVLFSHVKAVRWQIPILAILGAIILYLDAPKLWADLKSKGNQHALLCPQSNDYMRWWHPKLNFERFLQACAAKGL